MSDPASETNDDRPLSLLEAGWQQGILFDAEGASYEWNRLGQGEYLSPGPTRRIRPQKDERLVLISHACDIKDHEEKYVEALICQKHDPEKKILGKWDQNSPRYFIVDPVTVYVANAAHRIKFDKGALSSLHPDDHLAMDPSRFGRFVQWLTRRYDRPTIPDTIYNQFHSPVYASLQDFSRQQPTVFSEFNTATHDIRVRLPAQDQPPFAIGILYLTKSALTEDQASAIDETHRIICNALSVNVSVEEPVIMELDQTPYGVVRRTQPLIIDYPSWEDEDAAPPLWMTRD